MFKMKAIVQVGYNHYVMDLDKALTVLESLTSAEQYDRRYDADTKSYTYHVWEQKMEDKVQELKVIPESVLRLARLAGKPTK
jgi:tRNA U38,U39,U40 pseudouridine synthase TruA